MKKRQANEDHVRQLRELNQVVEDIKEARRRSKGRMIDLALRILVASKKVEEIEEKGK